MSEHHGKVWWSELLTDDVKKACDFYAACCGWDYEQMEAGGQMSEPYQVARSGGRPVAGIMNMKDAGMSEGGTRWFTYLAVDDVDEVANGAETGGGGVLRAPFDVEGIGRIAIIRDPNGAAIGFITPSVEDMPRDAAPE